MITAGHWARAGVFALLALAFSGLGLAQPSAVQRGNAKFQHSCAPCHGAGVGDDGHAMLPGTDALRIKYKSAVPPVPALLEERTDLTAPRGRVIAIDVAKPERANWREIIPQTGDRLEGVSLVNDQLIASYLHDAHSQIRISGRDGSLVRDVELPGIGSAACSSPLFADSSDVN